MTGIEAALLGLVQGLTEFLPVSSSGHLTICKSLFGIETSNLSFEVAVHAATVLSTIVAFRKEIWDLLKGFFNLQMNPQKDYIFKIGVSMVPIFIVGVFFKDYVEEIFGSGLAVVGFMLVVTASLLALSEVMTKRQSGEGKPLGYKEAFIIGLAQACAVLPGLSRSGSTISTGLMLGVKKSEIAKFSFLMVLVPILGEAFMELVGGDFGQAASGIDTLPLVVGFVVAFLSGLFACKLMINLVRSARLWGFAVYCAVAGIICIVSTLL
jgi:undecaprenyl-diphosphatase